MPHARLGLARMGDVRLSRRPARGPCRKL